MADTQFLSKCFGCDESTSSFCPRCGHSLCTRCFSHFHSLPNLKGCSHKLTPLSLKEAFECSKHGEKLQLYCYNDKTLICLVCLQGTHKDHDASPLSDAQEDLRETLKETRSEVLAEKKLAKQKLAEYEKKVVETEKRITSLDAADEKIVACLEEKNPALFMINWAAAVKLGLPLGEKFSPQLFAGDLSIADGEKLKAWLKNANSPRMKEIYRASRDGWNASTFHSKCDDRGPTLVIAKLTSGVAIGGYAAVGWQSSVGNNGHSKDASYKSFLFQMPSSHYQLNDSSYSTFYRQSYGPSFGNGGSCLNFSKLSKKQGNTCTTLGYELNGCYSFGGSCGLTFTELVVFSK